MRKSSASLWLVFSFCAVACVDVLDIRTSRYLATEDAGDGSTTTPGLCKGTLRVRVLYDMSGSTKDVGVPAGKGVVDHLRALDATGGIRGCHIELEAADTGYDVEQTLSAYRAWEGAPTWNDVSTIFGQGTPMTQALDPLATKAGKLLMTTAFNGELASPIPKEHDVGVPSLSSAFSEATLPVRKRSTGHPFVFFQATDYTTSARIAMNFAWKSGAKRVGFFACTTSAFCTDPVDGAKTFLPILGSTKVGRDLAIELEDDEPTIASKVDAYFRAEQAQAQADPTYVPVDWIWFGNTRRTLAFVGRALAKVKTDLGIAPKLVTDNWGLDEALYAECGDACVGFYGMQPYPVFGDRSVSGTDRLIAVHHARRQADKEPETAYAQTQYIYGYVAVAAWKLAVESTLDANKPITGTSLKDSLEQFNQVSVEGLATISYSPTDHRPQSSARVYILSPTGTLDPVGQPIAISTDVNWLGW